MNDQEKILRTAAERLLAVADGKTLEWASDGRECLHVGAWGATVIGSEEVRLRPPAAPPEPKPSQAVLDACKRLGVEAWKLDRYKAGDESLYPGFVTEDGVCCYGSNLRIEKSRDDQKPDSTARYWHVRPIAQAKLPELPAEYAPHPLGERKPELPCPPRPTPEQVAAARMPDGRKVKAPTVCEVPNGRCWFAFHAHYIGGPVESPAGGNSQYGQRRWIAEPAEDVVTPWALDPVHAGKVVVRKDGAGFGIIANVRGNAFVLAGVDYCVTPEQLKRDWTHNGQPCGEVQS